MTPKIIVLIGDIIASRKIKGRTSFDKILLKTMSELSEENPKILSPYTLTIGDEIQAVFSNADSLFHDAISIQSVLYPEKMRFSFGIGVLTKPINPKQAIGMDGPAFYNARSGVEKLKKTGNLFSIMGEDIPNLNLLQQTLSLISHNMNNWSRTRLQTLIMLQEKLPVKEIAAKVKISDKAVYKTIDAGALEEIKQLFNEIETIINKSI